MPARSLKKKKTDELEQVIAETKALRDAGGLSAALRHPSARVVIAAAHVLEEEQVRGCDAALVEAFARLVHGGAEADPQCRGKAALLRALMALEADGERDAYLLGRHCVQLEGAWGPPVDTAAEVRGLSVLGLIRARHPDAAVFAAEALGDSQRPTRLAAAHALGELPPDVALPLLRYKLALGDEEPEVFGAAFGSFFALSPKLGLELARELLSARGEPEQEAVLLALGESRQPAAFEVLRDYSGRASDVAFVALALLRHEPATAHLLQVIEKGPRRHAAQAVKALAHFRHDPALCERIRTSARARGDEELAAEVELRLAQ